MKKIKGVKKVERRGRPKLPENMKKKKIHEHEFRGRPSGAINEPNFFLDNSTYVHNHIYIIEMIRKWDFVKSDDGFDKEKFLDKLRIVKKEIPSFYREFYVFKGDDKTYNGIERNLYKELLDYLVKNRVILFNKKKDLYFGNERFKYV